MKTAIFIPPLPRHTGGVSVLLCLGQHLSQSGFETSFVFRETPLPLYEGVNAILWDDMKLDEDTLWLTPEGWPNALAPGFKARSRCLVYVQNWAFLLSALPRDTRWPQLPVRFLAVSDPVAWYIKKVTGLDADILRPGINLDLFYPLEENAANPGRAIKGTIKIAWMPRKNKGIAKNIRDAAEAVLAVKNVSAKIIWVEIEDRTQNEVAEILRSSHIFMATGFPEGFSLPPLEAMASGCVVAGFSGLGGFDYMRSKPDVASSYTPWWPLREVPWGPNGFYAADADIPGAAECLVSAVEHLLKGGPELVAIRNAAEMTIHEYSLQKQKENAAALWSSFESCIK